METKNPDKDGLAAHLELKDDISVKQKAESPIAGVSSKEYDRILRKVDYRVIPILAALYLLSFLDRGGGKQIRNRYSSAIFLMIDNREYWKCKYSGDVRVLGFGGPAIQLVRRPYRLSVVRSILTNTI